MATPLPFTVAPTARPAVAPPPQTRSALMARLLEQSTPDDMIAHPPQSVGEGLARTAGMGLDTLMAKKAIGAQQADQQQKLNDYADLLMGKHPELAGMVRKGFGLDVANQVMASDFMPKAPDAPVIHEAIDPATKTKTFIQASPGAPDTGFGPGWARLGGAEALPNDKKPTPYTDLGKVAADEQAGILTPDQAKTERDRLAAGPAPDFGDVGMLRKEIQALPSYKNVTQAMPIYRSMVKTAPNKTRASDLNLVYGLGKIMDPNSVVREGEMVMVKDTASLPDWFLGEVARVNGGNALQEDTRNAILAEAKGRMDSYIEAWGLDADQYKGIAARNRLKEADVIPTIGEMPEYVPLGAETGPRNPAPAADPDPAEVEAEMRRRGLLK